MARTSGTASVGFVLAVAGTGLMSAALLGYGWVALAGGGALLGTGILLVVVGFREPEPVLGITPAHVTFYQQVKRDLPLPVSGTRNVHETKGDLEPVTAEDLEISRLDVQIREVNRKINKATVMLGTGKLSDEGYRRYVEDLKHEKADLETRRVKLEMSRSD